METVQITRASNPRFDQVGRRIGTSPTADEVDGCLFAPHETEGVFDSAREGKVERGRLYCPPGTTADVGDEVTRATGKTYKVVSPAGVWDSRHGTGPEGVVLILERPVG